MTAVFLFARAIGVDLAQYLAKVYRRIVSFFGRTCVCLPAPCGCRRVTHGWEGNPRMGFAIQKQPAQVGLLEKGGKNA